MLDGDPDSALAEIEQESSELARLMALPMAYHALGRTAESDATLELVAKYERDGA